MELCWGALVGDCPCSWRQVFSVHWGGEQETPPVGQTTGIQAYMSPPSVPLSQLLKAAVEVTSTSAKAVQMANQQQDEQICWGNNSSVMSLGMWSPLAVSVATELVVGAFLGHLGLHLGTGPFLFSSFSDA